MESQLKEIVGEELAALSDPRIRGLVTVTAVRVSPDLAQATVFYSVLAGTDAEETAAFSTSGPFGVWYGRRACLNATRRALRLSGRTVWVKVVHDWKKAVPISNV